MFEKIIKSDLKNSIPQLQADIEKALTEYARHGESSGNNFEMNVNEMEN